MMDFIIQQAWSRGEEPGHLMDEVIQVVMHYR